ncbi:cadherin-like domain-containing protein [Pararhizobium polonicum]|uniref:cadherin-like domain-containing protein n=1 Tax=Pararhizobium polonicum TaxID=1612624 RepID=UPI00083A8DB6|nr:cadherin-like domain-containing protein [Pararhizobium polonicum]
MFNFTNPDNETDGGALELDGASFITSTDVGGTTYVFVAGAADNGISVFALGLDGSLTNVSNVTDNGSLNLTGVSGLSTITSNGNTYLIAAGAGDNGLSVFRVSTGGALTSVDNVADGGALNLGGVSRVTSATVGGNAYVFAAGTNDDGISVFRVAGDGALTAVANLADNATFELDGVKGLTTAVIGGNTFLFAAGGVDDGLSVFQVAANGTLTHTSSVTDNGTLKLDGASDVTTAVVGGVTYVFATGTADNGVSVFSVNSSGILTNVANVSDTASLRLAGATGLSTFVMGSTTYLTVGGSENGVSIFRVDSGGTLTFMDNIDDGGSRELAGTTQVHTVTVGGTSYVIGAGSSDDGVSVLGVKPTGQLWFMTEGGDADTRLVHINNDGSALTTAVDNGAVGVGDDKFVSSFTADVGLDTAAGFYFGVLNGGPSGDHAYLVRGVIGSSATPTTVIDFPDDIIVNSIQVDAINHRIYAGYMDGQTAVPAGIRVYDYNPLTGTLTDQGFLVTAATDSRGQEGGYDILDPRDFALDSSIGRLFYTETLTGGVNATGLFRLDLSNPNATTQLVSQAQFPDDGSNGYIIDVEVDQTTDLVYFSTESQYPSPDAGYNAAQNAIWYISENATNGTAVKVSLVGLPGGNLFYPGDMTFDQGTRQLYVESEESGSIDSDDVIYVFQLDGAGTTATLINTINPGLTNSGANIQGMTFSQIAELNALNGTAAVVVEQQAAATTLLAGAPVITDFDGNHLAGATVQITGGKFSSNETSNSDDHLGYGAAKQISGLISGTNITVSWNAATESLTLSGYDTIANYRAVLGAITYWGTGDNPTNYGLNTNRTITWTVNDGTPDIPAGAVNSGTTTITIAAVNDAPVNGTVTSASGIEDAASIAVTGLQISDADANPAITDITVTLSVTKGVLTLLTNVSGGLISGGISGNGTATVTLTGTLNEINATLAASNGLLFTGNANTNGTDSLTVVTNDGGNAGSGGAQSDTDIYTITINAVNDAPVVVGDGTETLAATNEDIANAALTNTVSALFSGQYGDSADQVSGGSSANAFAGVAVIANGSSASTGQWQYYNGAGWVTIGAASTAASVLIAASAPLRFLPAADYNGTAPTLTVKLVDASGGALTNGSIVNVTTSGGSTPYSIGTVVLDHMVTAINDAPVTAGGAAVTLTTIVEDSAPGAGQTISSLFASHFSDAKDQVSGGSSANALTGVAVTTNAATAGQGVYQYFSGGSWHDLPAVSTSSAFILDTSTLLRFVAAADYSGSPPGLIVHMIEDSSGAVTTGTTADLSTTGGSTQYGTAMTLGITVISVNDAPVVSGTAALTAVNEDTAAPGGQTVSALFGSHFSDADGDSLAGVAITGNAVSSQGVWQYFNGAWTTIGVPNESAALVLAAGTLVRFLPAANFNGTVPALTAYLIDSSGGAVTTGTLLDVSVNGGQTRFSDTSTTLSTSVTAVNDTPVVPALATTVGATEQTAATLLGSVTVSDVDLDARNAGAGDYSGASFSVQRASANSVDTFTLASGGAFTVSGGNLQVGGLTFATFSSSGGVLTINFTSSAATATKALVNDVINHITYTNVSDAPSSSVTLNYALNDGSPGSGQGTGGSATAGGSVTVNITAVNDSHTGGASITGTATEDQVLTAVSTLVDSDGIGTLHYQWQRDVGGGYVNVGADQATYTLGDGDIGGVVRVVIYYTDAGGTVESATSTASDMVAAFNDAPTGGASITGTATEDQILTADTATLADSDGLGTLHYDWQRDTGSGYVSIGAADQATYTLGDADVGGVVRVVVSYTDGQGFANSVTSAGTAAIANINDPHTGGVSVTGTASEDQILTANTATLADADGLGTLHYQWQRDTGSGYVNVGTDQATYTLGDADVGGVVRVVVSYTDQQGSAEAATSAGTAAIAAVNDPHTGGVSINGTATENQVLTAVSTLADADGLGTLHYQWQRNTGSGYVNVGADQSTYTLGDADVGGQVRVVVSYTDGQGFSETSTSTGTTAIAAVNDPHTGGVSITGTATENQVLTAVSTLADVDGLGTLHYQWQRNTGSGYVNVGTDQATYTLGDADVGGLVRVVVSYIDGQGFTETSTSVGTTSIANINDVPTGGVSIAGTATENQILTANTAALADADGLGTLHYQWQRNTGSGYVNVGTDQATYALGDADVGGLVRVVVSYTDQQGTAESVTSAGTASIAAVNDPHTGGVSITGTATEDQVLTAVSTLADVDGLGTLHYQWQRNTGSGYVNVGADQATYALGDADVGGLVRVVVSYIDGQGFTETSTSAGTATIAAVNDPHTGGASITGTATEDQVLTAVSTLADADGLGTLHYQWQRNTGSGYVNVGTDQATYTLGDTDVGGTVRVVVSYIDGQGFTETSTSAGTATIANVNDVPTGGVSIAGTATENQILTANTAALADADGLGTLHYQWQRNTGSGYVNVGADQATYTLGNADVGGTIRVVTSYTDQHGTAEAVTSAGTASIAAVNDPHTGGASIAGTATEDQVLNAVSTLADVDGLGTLHYQWQRNTGSGYVNVGTDQATYALGDADVGGTVRVVLSYTDGQGFAESATSAPTTAVINVNDVPTGGVSITGAAIEDQVLTANTAALADSDGLGTLHYQWQRNTGSGYVNVGTDQATYTLGDADVGGTIRVVTSYTDQHGTAEAVTSAGTVTITAVNDPHTGGASITGTATEDRVLTANTATLADADGLGTLHYQWQRNTGSGYVNVGTDQAIYTLGDADVGGLVRVVVSYTDGRGFAESATSAPTAAVVNVNDAPSGTNKTISTLEDTPRALTAADFGFSDSDGNAFARVKITTLPGAGTLSNNGVAVTAGQFVSIADITAGKLTFTPAGNANGSGYAHFTFQVADNGGTANGGINLDPTANTLTINVTPVNDAPSGTSKTISTLEDTPRALTAADFGFSDSDGNAFARVKITTLPGAGTLSNNGVAVTAGQFVSIADITAGKLTFTPAGNANGSGYAHFTFQVADNGGTANGGINLDPTANTLTINVTPVNDAPSGTNKTISTLEDTPRALTAADFGFSDSDGNAFARVKITTLPGAGTLSNNGVAVTAGQFVSIADITAGKLTFTPAGNANGSGYARFTFQVADNGGTANGGINLDPTANTLTINVTPVNDAPSGTNKTISTLEDTPRALTAADFGFSDVDGNAFARVKITTLPGAGTLSNNGVAVTAGQFVSIADITAGKLTFTPAGNANGSGYAHFTFQVADNGGTANGGINLDPTANTLTINVTPVNDAPALDVTQTLAVIAENASMVSARKVADLTIIDADGGNNVLSLVGTDAKLFEIKNGALWLKAGVALDFETNPVLDVIIRLDDPTIGTSYEVSKVLKITVSDVQEIVTGTSGNDILTGTSGDDTLDGKGGNDIIKGVAGNDILIAGTGIDTLYGGAGKDVFVFQTAQDSAPGFSGLIGNGALNPLSGAGQRDIIVDFLRGEDRLDLSTIDANVKISGDQAFVWKGAGNFSGNAGELIYRTFDATGTANDKTIVYGDVDLDGRADFQIELTGIIDLAKGDFIL